VARCPKCRKGFPLAMAGGEDKGAKASDQGEPAPPKKRFRPRMAWGLACARALPPVAALV
jgi:hypothetical protein